MEAKMIDAKIGRVKELIRKREEIDAELNALFGGAETRRGRPRKEQANGPVGPAVGAEEQSTEVGEVGGASTPMG
jgi:hypothetical protein